VEVLLQLGDDVHKDGTVVRAWGSVQELVHRHGSRLDLTEVDFRDYLLKIQHILSSKLLVVHAYRAALRRNPHDIWYYDLVGVNDFIQFANPVQKNYIQQNTVHI